MKTIIFAKHGTSEKISATVLPCQDLHLIQEQLCAEFGGQWLKVDEISIGTELVKFDDGLVYQGFHGKPERYCNGIHSIGV